MSEHRIRLRMAWERHDPDRRVDLPTVWSPEDRVGPFTLRRNCGGPEFESVRLPQYLEIAQSPGVKAVRLNGQIIAGPTAGPIRVLVTDLLQRRNRIEIDVDLADVEPATLDRPWGEVALVIVEG